MPVRPVASARIRHDQGPSALAAKRRWGYFALPVLYGDRLVGKADVIADRKASVLRVNAIHQDARFPRAITNAVCAELDDLAAWLRLAKVELPAGCRDIGQVGASGDL
jgi:hypothetical protein